MEKVKMNAYYLATLTCLAILVMAGSYFVYHAYLPLEDFRQNQSQDFQITLQPTPVIPAPIQHARAVAGWQITSGSPDSRYFYLYDPWPANYGAIYMEDFDIARNSYIGSILVKN